MNKRLRDILCCPLCLAPLSDIEPLALGGDSGSGYKCSQCEIFYPMTDGIPRMLASAMDHDPAAKSFGFQWAIRERGGFEKETLYGLTEEQEQRAFLNAYGVRPDDLRGKILLDAGCGDGALLQLVAECGADVVGVDINTSIIIPFNRCRSISNVSVLQMDIFQPCFAPGTFDFVWCEGVIIHTPDPLRAFQKMSTLVKPGGRLYIWVYPSDCLSVYQRIRDAFIAPYLIPRPLLYYLCYLIGGSLYPILHATGRKRSLRTIAFDLFDNLSPKYQWRYTEQEVRKLFTEAGFVDLRVTGKIGMSGRRAVELEKAY